MIPALSYSDALFQSTRPHGARLAGFGRIMLLVAVSIHAPARGATVILWQTFSLLQVSIHAPARGATGLPIMHRSSTIGFNPRARTGRDMTLTQGQALTCVFQSTRPHGARPSGVLISQ